MKALGTVLGMFILCLGLLWPAAAQAQQIQPYTSAPAVTAHTSGNVINVKFDRQATDALQVSTDASGLARVGLPAVDQLNARFNAVRIQRIFRPAGRHEARHVQWGLDRWYTVEFAAGVDAASAVDAYAELDAVTIAELRHAKQLHRTAAAAPVIFDDPLYGEQWHYHNTGQVPGAVEDSDIDLPAAHDIQTGSPDVVVSIVDSGIDLDHPDLVDALWVNEGEIPGNGIDDDDNGFIDDVHGFSHADGVGNVEDSDGHGTHVAGTVGARNANGIGVAGVAGGDGTADSGVRLMINQTFGNTTSGNFAEAYTYAADNGAVISQNSWGYTNAGAFEQAVLDAIDYFIANAGSAPDAPMEGGMVIFSAGNSNTDADWYPGFYDPTIAVASTGIADQKAGYSNFGAWVDISAPGGNGLPYDENDVLSTLPGGYGYIAGTSMAAPHASGVAALIISQNMDTPDGLTATQARGLLEGSVDSIDEQNPGFIGELGSGRVNANLAVGGTLDTTPPDAVTDLEASLPEEVPAQVVGTSVLLSWTATGDDGMDGQATEYDIRYSTEGPIDTEAAFADATVVVDTPVPAEAGTEEEFLVDGLAFETQYWFALRVVDDAGNESALSNSATATTGEGPSVVFDPDVVEATVDVGEATTETVALTNDGDEAVTYSFLGFAARNVMEAAGPQPAPAAVGPRPDYAKGTDPYAGTGTPTLLGAGGPDAFGYYWIDSNEEGGPTFSWFDISGVGTLIDLGDDEGLEITLPFAFPFYGEDKAGVSIASNGYLTFGTDDSDLSNDPIPSTTDPNDLIAVFWDDLDPADDGGDIYYYDDADNDRFIVQYTNVSHFPGPSSALLTFQVMLYRDGSILMQYLDVADVEGATVGVENADGTAGLQVVADAAYLENNLAVALQPVPNYISVEPASGTLGAGESESVEITFDAADLLGGTFENDLGVLVAEDGGAAAARQTLPTVLTVVGEPMIAVDPTALDFGVVFPGDTAYAAFDVVNDGTGVLEVTGITIDDDHYAAMPESFTVPPGGGSEEVEVMFAADALGSFPATLTLATNAGEVTVELAAEVLLPPDIAVSPDSLMAELLIGASSTRTVTVANEGDSDLNYVVSSREGAAAAVQTTPGEVAAPAPAGAGSGDPAAFATATPSYTGPTVAPADASDAVYQIDDGTTENSLGLTNGGDVMWMNAFEAVAGAETIRSISTAWGWAGSDDTLPVGHPARVLVYEDPNDDGDPTDAVLLTEADTEVTDPNTDQFTTVNIAPTPVEGVFFVAVLYQNQEPDVLPAPLDENSGSQGASWVVGHTTPGAFDTENLAANSVPPSNMDEIDFPGNWLLRADAAGGGFISWLRAAPSEGTVAPGESVDLEVTFDADGLDIGSYEGVLVVSSNDPDEPDVEVNAMLEVTSAPYPFALSPDSIALTLETDETAEREFTIANTTDEPQFFEIEMRSASGEGPNLARVLPEFERRVLDGVMAALSARVPDAEPTAAADLSGTRVKWRAGDIGLLEEVGVTAFSSSIGFASPFQDSYVSFDLGEPSELTPFGATPTAYAGDFLLGDEETFYIIGADDNMWMSVDAETGETTPITTVEPIIGDSWTEVATDPTDGTVYASTSTGLHTIDPATGAVEAVGPFGFTADEIMIAIAVDDEGNIWGHEIATDQIYSVDPETGAATPVGPTGVDANFAQGMDFDPVTGQLYMAWYEGGGVGGLRVVDTETGNTELIGPFQGDELGYLAIPSQGFMFVDADLISGTLAPMGDVTIDLNIDAEGLFAGTYHAEVAVVSNLPGEPEGLIPVTLTVLADPLAALAPDTLAFGEVFVTDSSTATVTLTNEGRDVLNVSSVMIDGAGFVLDPEAETSFALEPMESRTFEVTFAPTDVQPYEASFVVESDDPENPTIATVLTGTGIPAPVVMVEPDAIELQAYAGQTHERTMTVSNMGGSPLTCTVYEEIVSQPTLNAVYDDVILSADFESGDLPEGWMRSSNGVGWLIGDDLGSLFFGIPDHTVYAATNDDAAGPANDASEDYLITPEMDFSDVEEPSLVFKSYFTGAFGQQAYVEVSLDGGTSWTVVDSLEAADDWTEVNVDLSAYAGEPSVHLAFHGDDTGAWASGWAVDDVRVLQSFEWLTHGPCETIAPGESHAIPMTFDATGLAAGTYRVDMVVATNDPVNEQVVVPITFTVIEALSVTPMPEDSLVHPNEAFTVPIMVQSLDDLEVFSYEFTLAYDAGLIEATGVETEGTLSEDVLLAYNVTEGQIQVSAAEMEMSEGGPSTSLFQIEGEGVLLYVTFQAQEQLGQTEMTFTELFFNEGQPPASGGSATIQVVPLYGDANLNVSVTAFDAGLILDHTVGLASFSEAASIASEVSGNGSTTAFDAGLVLDYTVGLIDCFPVEPGCDAEPAAKRADETRGTLAWGTVTAEQQVMRLPLALQSAGGVRAFTVTVPFDEATLAVAAVESTLPEDWLLTHHAVDGVLKIAAAGRTALTDGAVATLELRHLETGGAPVMLEAEGRLNELAPQTLSSVEVGVVPETFALHGNYPNPFNPSTTISFDLPLDAEVTIDVIDVLGRRMLQVPAQRFAAGTRRHVQLDATRLSSGLYFYRIVAQADGERWIETGQMTLVK